MNGGTVQLFIGEASDDKAIPQDLIEQAKQVSGNEWLKRERYTRDRVGGDYGRMQYEETTPKKYTSKLFTGAMMNIIYNLSRNQKNESELEHDMQAKSRRQNRSQQHSYGRGI